MLAYLTALTTIFDEKTDISEEDLEEYKMLSGFKQKEIIRLRTVFLELTGGSETMTKDVFVNINGIKLNPLLDRVCVCFGLKEDSATLDFKSFLVGLSQFNSPGRREEKLKMAFKIQDFDDDGTISKEDLIEYLKRITGATISEEELGNVANEVMRETSTDPQQKMISLADFQRVVAPLDFQAKLVLPI